MKMLSFWKYISKNVQKCKVLELYFQKYSKIQSLGTILPKVFKNVMFWNYTSKNAQKYKVLELHFQNFLEKYVGHTCPTNVLSY